MAPKPRQWHGSWFGYFAGGAWWSSALKLYESLDHKYLSQTGIKRVPVRQRTEARWGYILKTNDAIGIGGLSHADVVGDLVEQFMDWDTWESDVVLTAESGPYLSVLTHTIGLYDLSVMLIVPEKSTIGRPQDMTQRGRSLDLLTVNELGNALLHKDVAAHKWNFPQPPADWSRTTALSTSSH